jgi:hypothetical protein
MNLTIIHPFTNKPLYESSGEAKAFRLFIPFMMVHNPENKRWAVNIGLHLAMLTSDLKNGCYVPLFCIGTVTGKLRITLSFFEHSLTLWPLGEE